MNELHHNEQFDVLIIENDPAMARLTCECFKQAGLDRGVVMLPDGDEALALLRHEAKYSSHAHPDLICLDLHLPKKSGLQVLAELKRDSRLSLTPVVVISGSDDPHEIRQAYELHASCYIRKPDDLEQFIRFIQVAYEFWGTVVSLPPKPAFRSLQTAR